MKLLLQAGRGATWAIHDIVVIDGVDWQVESRYGYEEFTLMRRPWRPLSDVTKEERARVVPGSRWLFNGEPVTVVSIVGDSVKIRNDSTGREMSGYGIPEIATRESIPDRPPHPYVRTWRGVDIDVYRICALWGASHPGQIQAIKKILCAGQRGGGKSVERDVEEAIVALQRWMEMRKEEE